MKIAMVSEHASPLAVLGGVDAGGQNVHVGELSAALARAGHEVTVYSRRDDPDLPERVQTPQGYTVVHVPAGPPEQLPKDQLLDHMGSFADFLDEQWQADRPDVAHAHFWMSGIATQLAARTLRVPTVQTFRALGLVKRRHQGPADTSPPVRLKLERLLARNATWIAATCTDEVFELTRMGRTRSRLSVVPCGVDLDTFCTEGPIAARGSMHRIVSVGRMVPRKGFQTMIEALPSIADTELVIVGGPGWGSEQDVKLLKSLAGLDGRKRIVWLGYLPRDMLAMLIAGARATVFPSLYEGFGLPALESMALGTPVITSNVSSLPEVVGEAGVLVNPYDVRAIAQAIITMDSDEAARIELSRRGLAQAARFDSAAYAERLAGFYAKIA